MRTSPLTAAALACTVVLLGAAPAMADTSPAPTKSAKPTSTPAAPTPAPTTSASPTAAPAPTTAPSAAPSPSAGQVGVVPKGAPDTGVPPVAAGDGNGGMLTGAALAGTLVVGGVGTVMLRRRAKARG
ncbi:hypothetical protein ABIA33_006127 [Streptacidiphilus sp. MAP12-16]|uniref:sortase-dependent protein n=1 Tax=Streptacidiphilus sp. MAP12-16 TaxID=3156300 RepID=UPI003517BE5F